MKSIHASHDDPNPRASFVALFDVLGFKDRIASFPLDKIVADYRNLIAIKRLAGRTPVVTRGGLESWAVATTVFSDTILLWCDDTWDAVQTLVGACAHLLASAVDIGWPLRGSLAYGECVLN